jgi:WD40 repeat protein
VAVIIGLFGLYAWTQKIMAETRGKIALSRQLAAQADKFLDSRFNLSLLLSIEACKVKPTMQARGALLEVLQKNPHLLCYLHDHKIAVFSVAFSPDGNSLASGGGDGTIILWNLATRQSQGPPLRGHKGGVWKVAFSRDGKTLASGSADGTVRLWDVKTSQPLEPPLTEHQGPVHSVALSPDGKTLASGGGDIWDGPGTITLWNIETREPLKPPLKGHKYTVWSIAFSPDGKTVASGSEDGTIRLWDLASREPKGPPLQGQKGGVRSVAFSPDGKTLASGGMSNDNIVRWDGENLVYGRGTIILWDLKTRQPLGSPLQGHESYVCSVAFSPDGKTLASGSWDKTIILWDVEKRQLLPPP